MIGRRSPLISGSIKPTFAGSANPGALRSVTMSPATSSIFSEERANRYGPKNQPVHRRNQYAEVLDIGQCEKMLADYLAVLAPAPDGDRGLYQT